MKKIENAEYKYKREIDIPVSRLIEGTLSKCYTRIALIGIGLPCLIVNKKITDINGVPFASEELQNEMSKLALRADGLGVVIEAQIAPRKEEYLMSMQKAILLKEHKDGVFGKFKIELITMKNTKIQMTHESRMSMLKSITSGVINEENVSISKWSLNPSKKEIAELVDKAKKNKLFLKIAASIGSNSKTELTYIANVYQEEVARVIKVNYSNQTIITGDGTISTESMPESIDVRLENDTRKFRLKINKSMEMKRIVKDMDLEGKAKNLKVKTIRDKEEKICSVHI